MSTEQLIAKSYEIRRRINGATDINERIAANMEMVGFLTAVNAAYDLIGADATLEICSPRRFKESEAREEAYLLRQNELRNEAKSDEGSPI
jgi:hypothetical protein